MFFVLSALNAGTQPKFTIIPTTPVSFDLSTSSTATVQYVVTNQTQITRTLTMVPIQGITQLTTDTGACASPFTLGYKESCLLTLELDGAQLPLRVTTGPEICKTKSTSDTTPDPFLCSQPAQLDLLNITRTNPATTDGTQAYVSDINGGISLCDVDATSGELSGCVDSGATYVTSPSSMVLNNTGNLMYITNQNDFNVALCTVNLTTGVLSECGITALGFAVPRMMALNSAGTFAYITNTEEAHLEGKISICPINSDGSLGTCTHKTSTTFDSPAGIALVEP